MKIGQTFLAMLALFGLLMMPLTHVVGQTSEQRAAVEAASVFADGAPHGEWERFVEPVRFFLAGTPDVPTGVEGAALSFVVPSGDPVSAQITPGPDGVTFAMPDAQRAHGPSSLHELEVSFVASCVGALGPLNPAFDVSVSAAGVDLAPGDATAASESVAATGAADSTSARYRHTFEFSGVAIPANTTFSLNLVPGGDPLSCSISLNNEASYLAIHADTGALNIWTAAKSTETTPGALIRSVPHASKLQPQQRSFELHVAYTSLYPCLAADDGDAETDSCAGIPDGDRISAMFADGVLGVRARNLDTNLVQSAGSAIGSPGVTLLDDSVQARIHTVTYTNSFETSDTPGQGRFQFEVFSQAGFSAASNLLAVGGKGFTFAPVGDAERQVNPGEPTTYRLLVTNTGAAQDVITVSVNVDDASWDVDVLNGQVTVQAGAVAEVLVGVTPPEDGIPGDEVQISARAVSSFPQEVDPRTLDLKVSLVSLITSGARLTGPTTPIEVFAGDDLDLSGYKLQNTGSRSQIYVIETDFIPEASGWISAASPASRQVNAESVEDFSVGLDVSPNAQPGQAHILRVQARVLGGGVPDGATLEIPISVIFEPGLDVTLRDPIRTLDDDPGSDPPDRDHDRSAVFRVRLANPTAVEQNFDVTRTWVNANGGTDGNPNACGSTSHRGWQMAFQGPDGTLSSLGRNLAATQITLAGGQMMDAFVVMQWNDFSDCAATHDQRLKLSFRSVEDSDFSTSVTMRTTISTVDAHAPTFEPGIVDDQIQGTEERAVREGNDFLAAQFGFTVTNDGSETDRFTVELPPAPQSGWTHTLAYLGTESFTHDGNPNNGDAEVICTSSNSQRLLRCVNIGVGDQLHFRLTVVPPDNEALGVTMFSQVIVTSLDDPEKKDSATLRTRTVGQNDFTVEALRGQPTQVALGQSGAIPFEIRNVGTADDEFSIDPVSASSGADSWRPRLSGSLGSQQQVSIPGGSDYAGFLLVEPSTSISAGSEQSFSVQVTSQTTGAKKTIELTARAIQAPADSIAGEDGNTVRIQRTGQAQDITVVYTGTSGCSANLRADVDALPTGWRVTDATPAPVTVFGSPPTASVTFQVTPPVGTLGTSNTALRITGTCGSGSAFTDILLTVDSDRGVDLSLVSPSAQFVNPGGATRWEIDVSNTGLDQDLLTLSHSSLPPGWTLDFESTQFAVGPLQTVRSSFDLNVPADAPVRSNVTFNIFATSQSDASAIEQVRVSAIVGFRDILLEVGNITLPGAPEESVSFGVTVTNGGTLSDRIALATEVATPGYDGEVTARAQPEQVELQSGLARDIVVTVDLGSGLPPEVDIVITLTATSLFSEDVETSQDLTLRILDFARADIDGDLVDEYAIDRNQDAADGFESFSDSGAPGGRQTVAIDLAHLMSAAARNAKGLGEGDRFVIDGDEDGRVDHLLDDTGDGLPDIYWDPDDEHHMRLSIAKDVDADAVVDYFVDTDGDGRMDRLYNVVTGDWTPVIAIEGDGDRISYIVDSNGNGQADADESILVVSAGRVVRVTLMVDIDGDGKLDTVVDEDGDDKPDFFIRAGETRERRIVLQDVNGDGVEDWTYDSNLDGRVDAYYDPATQTGGHTIDTAQNFGQLVKDYWYVPVLFLLVVVLFIVLVAVTRR